MGDRDMTDERFEETYAIPGFNLQTLQEAVEKINKRARKLGRPEVQMDDLGTTVQRYYQEKSNTPQIPLEEGCNPEEMFDNFDPRRLTIIEFHEIRVSGEKPHLQGWKFIASIQQLEEATLVRCVPGEECPEDQRNRGRICDHCGTIRNRKDTFVLQHEDGRYVQVGRKCIQDFLGAANEDPHAAALWATMLYDLKDLMAEASDTEGGFGGGGPRLYDLKHLLEVTGAVIKVEGWLSSTKAREQGFGATSTACSVMKYMEPPRGGFKERRDIEWAESVREALTDKVKEQAEAAIWWAAAVGEDNDYLYNIKVVANIGHVDSRGIGLAVSIYPSYQRHMEREVERKERDLKFLNSRHIGSVGEAKETMESLTSTSWKTKTATNLSGSPPATMMRTGNMVTTGWFGAPSRSMTNIVESSRRSSLVAKCLTLRRRRAARRRPRRASLLPGVTARLLRRDSLNF